MDPVSLSDVNPGSQVMFSVTASADPAGGTITYQWRQNGTDIMDDDKFSGATTGTLTISDVQESDQATYECVVTNNDGVDVREATLDVRKFPPNIMRVHTCLYYVGVVFLHFMCIWYCLQVTVQLLSISCRRVN